MPLKLSRRAEIMPASPIRRFAPLAVEARQKGRNIFALNIGQPDIPTPKVILDRLKSYSDAYIPYGPSQGLPEYIEALRWYRLAADQGNVDSQFNLALLYAEGHGVVRDLGQARQWMQKAAAAGDPEARKWLHANPG